MEQQNQQPIQEKTETKPSIKTDWKLFGVVTIVAVILAVGGILLLKTMQPPSIEEQVGVFGTEEVYTSLTINVLNDEDLFNILNYFADQEEYLKIEDFGAKDLLKDAVQKGNHDIKNRIKEARNKFEARLSEGLEDAPEARAFSLVYTKLCIAESIVSNDLQRTTEICGVPENPYPDDITASMQVLPYFVAGMAYRADGNKERAGHYFSKITSHKQAIVEQYGEGSLNTAGEVYKMILDKVEKLSASDLSILPTSDWQTYRNEEFGFEVRYPESFLRKEFSARTNEEVFGISLRDKKYQEGHYPTLYVVVIKTSLSPREWLEKYYDPAGPPILGDIPEPPTGYENVEEITINGIPALRFRLLAPSDSSLSTIIQGKAGTLYHVQAISSGLGNFPRELHDQILSTFRFAP